MPDRPGTAEDPWDIASALAGGHPEVRPGDTIWIGPATYHATPEVGGMGYEVRLAGREGQPIRVRARPRGDHRRRPEPRIPHDLRGDPRPGHHRLPADRPAGAARPHLSQRQPALGRPECPHRHRLQFINLVIHDNSQGVSWWTPSKDGELYGCLVLVPDHLGHGETPIPLSRSGLRVRDRSDQGDRSRKGRGPGSALLLREGDGADRRERLTNRAR